MKNNNALDSIKKHSLHFFSGTFLSRISGYIRDVAMASSFGADPLISLFLVGFRTSNLWRRLFGEGALQSILISSYEKARQESLKEFQDERLLFSLRQDFHKTWSLSLIGFITFVILLLSLIQYWANQADLWTEDIHLILNYTALMMPGLWFICMSALNDAFLKAQHRFLLGSSAPIAFNIIWALSCYFLRNTPGFQAALMMCLGICLAYGLQWLVTYVGMRSEIHSEIGSGSFWSPKVRKLLKPMLQGMLGVGATQINGLMDAFFALKAEIAGPTYLWFAIRIEQAPLALIGLAISSAGLPLLARALERNDQKEALEIYQFSFYRMLGLMMPVCSAMMCLAFWGVRVALERGDFQAYDTSRTALCLWGYSLGLMGQGILFLVQNLCFSVRLYPLVTRSSLYAVGFNFIGNWICVAFLDLGAPAIAITTTLATFVQLLILHRGLRKKGKGDFCRGFNVITWAKYTLAFIGTFVSVSSFISYTWQLPLLGVLQGTSYPPSQNTWVHLWHLAMVASVWVVSYIPLCLLLKLPLPWNARNLTR